MTLTIDITPETENRLREKAAHAGQALPEYIRTLLETNTDSLGDHGESPSPHRKLSELRGLGAEMWRKELAGRDAQDYVNKMRDEWERPS